MSENRGNRSGVLLLGGLALGYLALRGGSGGFGGGGGGGWSMPAAGDEGPAEEQSGEMAAPPTASEAGPDTSITRLAPEGDAGYVREQQEAAAEDPDTMQGQITGAEPGTVDAGVTASAGGGRGPRFDSESGGEVVLSEPDEETSSGEDTSIDRISSGSMSGDSIEERSEQRRAFAGSTREETSGEDGTDDDHGGMFSGGIL